MEFLLLLLFAITVRSALAIDLQDLNAPDYNLDLSDNTQKEYKEPSGAVDDDAKEAGNLKYNVLLFLLHNEKSNKAVLAHINKKDDDIDIDRTIHTDDRNADGNAPKSDDLQRQKRSAIKWLSNFFRGNRTTPSPKNKPPILKHLLQSRDNNVNATFADIFESLTNTIKMLNQNLVSLKNEIANNEGYVFIKMPIKEIEDNNKTQIQELKRPKREAIESKNTHVNVTGKDKLTKNVENFTKSLIIPNKKSDLNIYDMNQNFMEPLGVDVNAGSNASVPTNLTVKDKQTNFTIRSSKDDDINDLDGIRNNLNNTTINITAEAYNNIITTLRTNTSIEANNKSVETQPVNTTDANANDFLLNSSRRIDFKDVVKKSVNEREQLVLVIKKLYKEIKDSMLPVKDIKDKYSRQSMFKIGYIVANIDTLEFSLNRLMKKLARNKTVWGTKRLLRVFKKLSLSKHLVANVMNFLYSYAGDRI